jgi:uncharacterized membrane protein
MVQTTSSRTPPARTSAPPADARRGRYRAVLAAIMVGIGLLHFFMPGPFVSIVPSALPAPYALVIVSGFFEVLGGVGLLVPRVRRAASIGLVLLYVAVFPANINMVLHPELGRGIPEWSLWARLPLQLVFIAWALWVGRARSSQRRRVRSPLDLT